MTTAKEERFGITEAAALLNRSPQTLRSWDRKGLMPKRLRPKRDKFGNRYWTTELIQEIKDWIAKSGFHPGRGIAYSPTPEELERHINKMRASNKARGKRRRRASRNGVGSDHAATDGLRVMVSEALSQGIPHEEILAKLPSVAEKQGVPLDEALLVVSQVVAA